MLTRLRCIPTLRDRRTRDAERGDREHGQQHAPRKRRAPARGIERGIEDELGPDDGAEDVEQEADAVVAGVEVHRGVGQGQMPLPHASPPL